MSSPEHRPAPMLVFECPFAKSTPGSAIPPSPPSPRAAPLSGSGHRGLRDLTTEQQSQFPSYPFRPAPYGMPSESFDSLRQDSPISAILLPSGVSAWLFLTYELVAAAHKDTRLSRAEAARTGVSIVPNARMELTDGILQNMDGVEHARRRKVLADHYGRDQATIWAEIIRREAYAALDGCTPGTTFDLRADFFEPVAQRTTEAFYGFPMGLGPRFLELIFVERTMVDLQARLLDALRRGDGLSEGSHFARIRDSCRESGIGEIDLVNNLLIIIAATYQGIGGPFLGGLFALLRDRSQWETCLRDRSVLPNAVAEMLRCFPNSDGQFIRVATEDMSLGGFPIRGGDPVMAPFAAANCDPTVFPEPRSFDVRRPNSNKHLAFGTGKHFCMGWLLVDVWMRTALDVLLERVPSLRLAVDPDSVTYEPSQFIIVSSLRVIY